MADMAGKLCIITGGTAGIGLATAEQLAERGARLFLVGRDPERGAAALAGLRRRVPGLDARLFLADLSRLEEMRRLASDLLAALPRIDVLINNAGAIFFRRDLTADGFERTFALNHLSYFVLTLLLRDRLIASAPARIVNVASRAHEGATLDFDDLQTARDYRTMAVYGRSKLCNILFTRELARRIAGTGVTANCLHPGFVASRIAENNLSPPIAVLARLYKRLAGLSPEEGARTSVYLASAPEVAQTSGLYFVRSKPAQPSAAAEDDAAARRLWEVSARLAGLPA